MNSMNKFIVIGRLTKDPVIKTINENTKVCNITVATERDYKDKEGNKITDFLNFSLWNKDAERINNLSKKGALITLEGYNTTKEIDNNGEKIYVNNPVVVKYTHLANAKEYSSTSLKEEKQEEMEK